MGTRGTMRPTAPDRATRRRKRGHVPARRLRSKPRAGPQERLERSGRACPPGHRRRRGVATPFFEFRDNHQPLPVVRRGPADRRRRGHQPQCCPPLFQSPALGRLKRGHPLPDRFGSNVRPGKTRRCGAARPRWVATIAATATGFRRSACGRHSLSPRPLHSLSPRPLDQERRRRDAVSGRPSQFAPVVEAAAAIPAGRRIHTPAGTVLAGKAFGRDLTLVAVRRDRHADQAGRKNHQPSAR